MDANRCASVYTNDTYEPALSNIDVDLEVLSDTRDSKHRKWMQ